MSLFADVNQKTGKLIVSSGPRTPSMILADSTNPTQRTLIDVFARLSLRQREAIYAMRQHGRLEKVQSRWCAPGHDDFAGKIVRCLLTSGLAKFAILNEQKRIVHIVELSASGKRMMNAIDALDALFFRNLAEIGAGA